MQSRRLSEIGFLLGKEQADKISGSRIPRLPLPPSAAARLTQPGTIPDVPLFD